MAIFKQTYISRNKFDSKVLAPGVFKPWEEWKVFKLNTNLWSNNGNGEVKKMKRSSEKKNLQAVGQSQTAASRSPERTV